MWKYIDKNQCKEFLLSLDLISDKKLSDKMILKKLYTISNKVENNYNVYRIRKRNGNFRTVYEPNYVLKGIQRKILDNVLSERTISQYAKAYKKGVCLKDNAFPHKQKKVILKLDIEDFFSNISFNHIYNSCFSLEYFPKSVGVLLTHLCTYNGYLPQGAPTSAYISNLVMRDFDGKVGAFCEVKNISYTRYSDDLTFSGDFNPSEVIKFVRRQLLVMGFEIKNKKTCVIKQNKRQLVTGIVVNEKIQVNKYYQKKIRQEMYYIKKYGVDSHLNRINCKDKVRYLNSLYGRILYVLQVNENDEFLTYKVYLKGIL